MGQGFQRVGLTTLLANPAAGVWEGGRVSGFWRGGPSLSVSSQLCYSDSGARDTLVTSPGQRGASGRCDCIGCSPPGPRWASRGYGAPGPHPPASSCLTWRRRSKTPAGCADAGGRTVRREGDPTTSSHPLAACPALLPALLPAPPLARLCPDWPLPDWPRPDWPRPSAVLRSAPLPRRPRPALTEARRERRIPTLAPSSFWKHQEYFGEVYR